MSAGPGPSCFDAVVSKLCRLGWSTSDCDAPAGVAMLSGASCTMPQQLLVLDYNKLAASAWTALLPFAPEAAEACCNVSPWLTRALGACDHVVVVGDGHRPSGGASSGSRRDVTAEWVWALSALWCCIKARMETNSKRETAPASATQARSADEVGPPLRKRFWIVSAHPPVPPPVKGSATELVLWPSQRPQGHQGIWPYALLWTCRPDPSGFEDLAWPEPSVAAPAIDAAAPLLHEVGELLRQWFLNKTHALDATSSHRLSNEIGPELLELAAHPRASACDEGPDPTDVAYVQFLRMLTYAADPGASDVPALASNGVDAEPLAPKSASGHELSVLVVDDEASRYHHAVGAMLSAIGTPAQVLPGEVEHLSFFERFFRNAWSAPQECDASVVLLDLRLWKAGPGGSDKFIETCSKARDRLAKLKLPSYPQLELLPRLVAMSSPSLPVLLFSSSTQRDIIARLAELRNMDVRSLKPALTVYPQDTSPRAIRARWRTAFDRSPTSRLQRVMHAHGTWSLMLTIWASDKDLLEYLEDLERPELSVALSAKPDPSGRDLLPTMRWPSAADTGPLGWNGNAPQAYRAHPLLWLRRDWLALVQAGHLREAVSGPWRWFEANVPALTLKWVLNHDPHSPMRALQLAAGSSFADDELLEQTRDVGVAFADLLLQLWKARPQRADDDA